MMGVLHCIMGSQWETPPVCTQHSGSNQLYGILLHPASKPYAGGNCNPHQLFNAIALSELMLLYATLTVPQPEVQLTESQAV